MLARSSGEAPASREQCVLRSRGYGIGAKVDFSECRRRHELVVGRPSV
jgi:hypothetical protein